MCEDVEEGKGRRWDSGTNERASSRELALAGTNDGFDPQETAGERAGVT